MQYHFSIHVAPSVKGLRGKGSFESCNEKSTAVFVILLVWKCFFTFLIVEEEEEKRTVVFFASEIFNAKNTHHKYFKILFFLSSVTEVVKKWRGFWTLGLLFFFFIKTTVWHQRKQQEKLSSVWNIRVQRDTTRGKTKQELIMGQKFWSFLSYICACYVSSTC